VSAGERRGRVFVFCRPYLIEDFRVNVASLAQRYEFRFLSDGRCDGVTDTRERFYARLETAQAARWLSAEQERDFMARCSLLRNLQQPQALKMIRAMASVLEEELEAFRPEVILSHMVDDYITHLLSELARARSIVYVGYAYSYFPGKVQSTSFSGGAPHDLRDPPDEEVRAALQEISQRTFRQNYLQQDTYSPARHLKAMLRYRVKQVVFTFKAWRERDPLHLHYRCLPFVVERRHWRDFPAAADFHVDWRQRMQGAADASQKPIVYLPLGYFPEATIDYWIEDRRFLDYERTVLTICRELGRHFRVLVKEHLHMLGGRSPVFYRALRDTAGVTSVPPLEFSNDVLETCDLVLMGAGSIGVEAFIRGKPIASVCDRSYWFDHARATRLEMSELDRWPQMLLQTIQSYVPPAESDKVEFVRECLRSTMRTLRPGKVWPICVPEDLQAALAIASRVDASPVVTPLEQALCTRA
jgi:hypothetical protein